MSRHTVAVVLVSVVVLSAAGGGVGGTASAARVSSAVAAPAESTGATGSPGSFVSVRTRVTPARPAAGEPFELTTTLKNGEDSATGYAVASVTARAGRDDTTEAYASTDDVGFLRPGESVSADLSMEFNETGTHTVYVHAVVVRPDGQRRRVVSPVRVRVFSPGPSIAARATPAPPGRDHDLRVTVANGESTPLRGIELLVNGTPVDAPRRAASRIGAGESRTFTFSASGAGTERVEATLRYTAADGTRRTVTRTLTATFEAPPGRESSPEPLVTARSPPAPPGGNHSLRVTLANGDRAPIRGVELSVSGVGVDAPRRVLPLLEAGTSRTFEFAVDGDPEGSRRVRVSVTYTTENGTTRELTRTLSPTFRTADGPPVTGQIRVGADAGRAPPGAPTNVTVAVTNGLSVDLRQYELRLASESLTVDQPRRVGGAVESGATRKYTFAATGDATGTHELEATVTYTTANGTERTVTRTLPVTVAAPQNPGRLTVTGVDFTRKGSVLQVSGTAANPGGTPVTGAVIRVAESDSGAVSPAPSRSRYFVGEIPASDFVSFDVNARLEGNASEVTVPLRVEYAVDGVTRNRTITLTYASVAGGGGPPRPGAPPGARRPARSSGGGPPVPVVALVAVVALVVVAVGVRRLRS